LSIFNALEGVPLHYIATTSETDAGKGGISHGKEERRRRKEESDISLIPMLVEFSHDQTHPRFAQQSGRSIDHSCGKRIGDHIDFLHMY
jgi:hypothetical protein